MINNYYMINSAAEKNIHIFNSDIKTFKEAQRYLPKEGCVTSKLRADRKAPRRGEVGLISSIWGWKFVSRGFGGRGRDDKASRNSRRPAAALNPRTGSPDRLPTATVLHMRSLWPSPPVATFLPWPASIRGNDAGIWNHNASWCVARKGHCLS